MPEITLGFWLVKVLVTTLGETGGDAASMSMGLGYLLSTAIFAAVFALAVAAQIRARAFHPALYWFTIIASTTVGTTLADFATRELGIGYTGGSLLLLGLLAGTLLAWRVTLGSVAVDTVNDAPTELFYWLTVTFSQTLGTALGDWVADTAGLGYAGGVGVFVALLLGVAALYRFTAAPRTVLFWLAFILTRPLGAVVGDLLDKPVAKGGLALSRYSASFALVLAIALAVWWLPQRAATRAH